MFFECRKNIVDPEDPRCARLTLTGQMIAVSPEEVEFAKQAMFSRFVCVFELVCPEIYSNERQRSGLCHFDASEVMTVRVWVAALPTSY